MIPTSVQDTISALREERQRVSARLDAIELSIENLGRVFPETTVGVAAPSRQVRVSKDSDAERRREMVLATISRARAGLTGRQVRKGTPGLKSKELSNALQGLKARKQIRRSGKTWVAMKART